jgi:hypothetical protein
MSSPLSPPFQRGVGGMERGRGPPSSSTTDLGLLYPETFCQNLCEDAEPLTETRFLYFSFTYFG